MNSTEWYEFLHYYYQWKFTDPRVLATRKRDLVKYIDRDQLGDLDQCRQALLDIDISNIRASLILVQKICGLAVAGASGLLALIYPNEFGTVDRYVTEALQRTDNIEEAQRILKINPARLTLDDGVVLIETFRKNDLTPISHPAITRVRT